VNNSPTPISLLRALAKAEKRPVRSVNMYDPDVCGDFDLNAAFEGGEPPPDRLRHEVRLAIDERRFAIRASDRYLAIDVRGDFAAGLFSINRPSMLMAFFYGEMRKSPPVGEHPVYVRLNDAEPPALQQPGVREAILALRLERDEILKVYANGISAYLRPRPQQLVIEILKLLAKLANELPADETRPLPLSELPAQFRPLIPLIRKWGIGDDADRSQGLERASRRQLQALVRRVSPSFESINAYLDGFGDNVPEAAAALGSLAEAAAEAKLILQAPDSGGA
jgi:hypothetical protein